MATRLRIVALDVEAMHGDRAGRGPRQAGEHADQGRLACAVGAEETEELALLDLEGDVVDGLQAGQALRLLMA
ncbi:Uncharacterised protein [Streptococcus dysgalactiae subsp. equisimilis]|nr:Uncharacterised protein [Streptococcus dysgalactiae subsp. equisimilis]